IHEQEAELEQLRGVDGERALDAFLAGSPGTDAALIMTAERKLEDLKAARVALGGRIRKAIIELGKARAAVPRAKAKKLQAELDKHNARTAELLFALQDHAGCRYEAVLRPAGDTIYSERGEMHFPREEQQVPKSIQLENELARLYAEAAGFEARA